jgi:hypothetical protein
MGKKKGKKKEKQRKRVSTESVCTGFYRRKPSVGDTISDSTGGSNTPLNGYPGLNPSVFLSVNSSEKIHVITPLQLSKKGFLPVGDRSHQRNVSVGKYRLSLRWN